MKCTFFWELLPAKNKRETSFSILLYLEVIADFDSKFWDMAGKKILRGDGQQICFIMYTVIYLVYMHSIWKLGQCMLRFVLFYRLLSLKQLNLDEQNALI